MRPDQLDDYDEEDKEFLEPGNPDLFDDPEMPSDSTFLWLLDEERDDNEDPFDTEDEEEIESWND